MEKKCKVCKENKEVSEFNKNASKKDSLQVHCRACSHKRFKHYYYKNKEKHLKVIYARKARVIDETRLFVYEYLKTHPCVVCGEKDPVVLDFDHLSNKRYNLSSMANMGHSIKTIELEIAKCQVLCANCHRRKTAKDFAYFKFRMADKEFKT